jgi:putative glutamine amidotransferase
MIDDIDGLIIPGGSDADPALFGQPKHERTKLVDKDRQAFDLAMLSLAEARGIPVLGICLGCQLMNVHRRGTLHQHLPDVARDASLEHSRRGDHTNYHNVIIRGGTHLSQILTNGNATEIKANSRHHQGIAQLGHGLIATASASDGVIEAIEDPSLPFWVAVQWHPENLGGTDHDALFAGLVAAAQKRRAK